MVAIFLKRNRWTLRLTLGTALAVILAPLGLGEDKTREPHAFQKATVRLSKPDSEGRCAPNKSVGQHFVVKNCPLGALVLFAYDVLQEQVSGENTFLEEEYDITADAGQPVSRSQMKRMLQSLLTDRFKLGLRREMKEALVYALVVGKDGPNFRRSEPVSEGGPTSAVGSTGQLVLQNAAMADLVFALSRRIRDRIVVDKTGLDGKYDLEMAWYLRLAEPNPPAVFTALQELGLRLEPQKSPVEFLVIDHVEKPSRN